jgi:hypothetical protein
MARWQRPATPSPSPCAGLGLKSDVSMHRAHSGLTQSADRSAARWMEPWECRTAWPCSDQETNPMLTPGTHNSRKGRSSIRYDTKKPAAARNFIPLSRFPRGKAGAGMVAPTPRTLRASPNRWHASLQRLPPQEGFQSAPLNPPLRHPPTIPRSRMARPGAKMIEKGIN